MSTARHFDESKYENNYIPGVPMRDIEESEWEALDDDQKATVDASPFFRKTAPAGKAAARKADDKE